jgi:hypothetical protein
MQLDEAKRRVEKLKRGSLKAELRGGAGFERIVFTGGHLGEHSLSVVASDKKRVRVHWQGYCERNHEPGKGMGRRVAQGLCEAFGARPTWKSPPVAEDGTEAAGAYELAARLRVTTPSHHGPARIELYRLQHRGQHELPNAPRRDVVLASVPYLGRREDDVADELEAAFEAAGCYRVAVNGVYTYVASTHYRVRVVKLTARRAFISGRYRHGGKLERWVQRGELSR